MSYLLTLYFLHPIPKPYKNYEFPSLAYVDQVGDQYFQALSSAEITYAEERVLATNRACLPIIAPTFQQAVEGSPRPLEVGSNDLLAELGLILDILSSRREWGTLGRLVRLIKDAKTPKLIIQIKKGEIWVS